MHWCDIVDIRFVAVFAQDGWTDPSALRAFFQRCPNHLAIDQMEDPTHPYYDHAVAQEWEDIKVQTLEKRQQGLSKEQNRMMRDKIHESKLSLSSPLWPLRLTETQFAGCCA